MPPRAALGVQTLRCRQSSLIGSVPVSGCHSGTNVASTCGERGPNAKASRTPVHGVTLSGGRKRRAPAVDAPYGTALNVCTPSTSSPRTRPAVVSTIAPGVAFESERRRAWVGKNANARRHGVLQKLPSVHDGGP